ncbi:PadR family transcriptional regulator [Vibrio marisflavi]|uniref:Transcription regulator PadR N-terminal domain-containing protein n=1 Tax=Vibrio marisflavi CECT 7928 TaxID=634439 RepID=A0ABM9A991_9VIBR|nr:PadR family transcriptional regulator [Vibrio marisflavi]CAH0542997.1 hypothetical protein VMF7928_04352 [Vibrio marisflavi CECT 7928]
MINLSNLSTILLSEISKRPVSGYDLMKGINKYWKANHQQIYRELPALEKKGLVKHDVYPQEGKPDRKVYTILPAGLNHLATKKRASACPSSFPTRHDSIAMLHIGNSNYFIAAEQSLVNDIAELEARIAEQSDSKLALIMRRELKILSSELEFITESISLLKKSA